MNFAKVSVVIPCFKSKETIARAVDSVFQQTLRPYEVILVDDCSPDDTLDFLYELQGKYPDNWIKVLALTENVGAGSARNRGWDIATQDYVAFLDSDDSWHPQKIAIQYQWMRDNPDVILTGHDCEQLETNTMTGLGDYSVIINTDFRKISAKALLISNKFPTRTVMLKRKIDHRFKENKRYSEDYLLWLEIILSGSECYKSPARLAFLYKANFGEGGLSANLWEMEKGELVTYYDLSKKGLISAGQYALLSCFSLLKFLRRLILR